MYGDLKEVTKLVLGGAWQTFPADGITITTVGVHNTEGCTDYDEYRKELCASYSFPHMISSSSFASTFSAERSLGL